MANFDGKPGIASCSVAALLCCSVSHVAAEPTNPFARPEVSSQNNASATSVTPSHLTLRGTLVDATAELDGQSPFANINGKLYERGDLVEGYRIRQIHAESVELTRNGKRTVLTVRTSTPAGLSQR